MYNQNFIIGQLIFAANQPKEIETYQCLPNEVKLLSCVYDLETGEFKGIREQVAYIGLRGDKHELFYHTASKKTNLKFCTRFRNNKFEMLLSQQVLRNILMRL